MRAIITDGLQRPPHRDPGLEPRQDMLPIDRLVIDLEYQREIKADGRRAIERIAAAFEWTKFSAVVVAPVSNRRFAIIDGQHRTTAAALVGITHVPCLVQPLDRAGQAAAFAAINGSVTKITPWIIYKAALAAGEGWAVQCRRVAEAAGCKLMLSNKSAKDKEPGELYGVNTMRDLIAKHGESTVMLALSAYRQSVYGDLALAWSNVYVLAWISAVASVPKALAASHRALAAFHDSFDLLEVDDIVQAELRAAKREGRPALAHWAALATRIADALAEELGA